MKRLPLVLILILSHALPFARSGAAAPEAAGAPTIPPRGDAPAETAPLAALSARADALLARADLVAYRGWLKFLRFEAETAARRFGAASETARQKRTRFDEWITRIAADPAVIGTLRGVQEWAYESPVDDSGQPFKLNIPTDYDGTQPRPLLAIVHGYSGNHLEHSGGMQAHAGSFEVAVLGRARGGQYTGLSQADVLHAIDYIAAHWRIDPDRVRLAGGSMGGAATFKLGSRFPHRFAAGRITCGYVEQEPPANLLTFPIYATHSRDDWNVPIVTARGPLGVLRALGGDAILDETNGYGHAVWEYAEGNARGDAWLGRQVRPESRHVRRLDFTALDGGATRAWWAEIVEWGPLPQPAHFAATMIAENFLNLEHTNVGRLQLRLDEAPVDRSRALRLSLGGAVPREIPAPLPDRVVVTGDGAIFLEADTPPATRRHAPGGALQVYDGSPLLIVYGTGGGEAARTALHAAAIAASKSPNPMWAGEEGQSSPLDRVPHHQLLYGFLRVKADREVTEEDITRCNLVLIGTAAENSVVAQLAERLPVRFDAGKIACADGVEFPAAPAMLGFTHFNPLAPGRLIFWVAATDPAAYAADALVPQLAAGVFDEPTGASGFFVGADLVIADPRRRALIATRSLDRSWNWIGGRESSPRLPASFATGDELWRAMALAVRRATGADYAFTAPITVLGAEPITPGVTRVIDLEALHYGLGIELFDLTGEELLTAHARLSSAHGAGPNVWRLEPSVQRSPIEPKRSYRVAVPVSALAAYAQRTQSDPRRQSRSAVTLPEALARFLAIE